MTNEQFQEILGEILTDISGALEIQKGHYAFGEDRLANFKRAGLMLNVTPAKALMSSVAKEDTAILDYIELLGEGKLMDVSRWKSSIVEAITYRILLLALVTEIHDVVKAQKEGGKNEN